MSILVRFAPPSMTTAQYEQVKAGVADAAGFPPKGMEFHACFGAEGSRRVTEVWSSKEEFQAFGEHLMPAITAAGIAMHEPEILPVRSMMVSDEPMPADDTGLVVRLRGTSMTMAQYEQVSARLGEQGLIPPQGSRVHVLMGDDGALQVGEVWAGAKEFEAFRAQLRPVLEEAGVTMTEPELFPLHALAITEAARHHATV